MAHLQKGFDLLPA